MSVQAVLAVASVGMQVMGQLQAGKQAKAQADFQAAQSRNNAIVAQQRADDERKRGELEAAQFGAFKTKQQAGKIRAALAGSGQLVSDKSAIKGVQDTLALGRQDSLTLVANADRRARALEFEAANLNAQGEAFRVSGKNALSSSRFAALGTVVGGASAVNGKWNAFKQSSPNASFGDFVSQ